MNTDGRHLVLGRIREALRYRAKAPGTHGGPSREGTPADAIRGEAPVGDSFRDWLPKVGETWEEKAELFARNSASLKTDFQRVQSVGEARAALVRLARKEVWGRVAVHRSPRLEPLLAGCGLDFLFTDDSCPTTELEQCSAGISTCECLVAQTGSVLVTSRNCGGRALSVLPPHHVAVATRDQLVPDLTAAFNQLRQTYRDDYPSMMSFITGPSRTGDIERILVLGAHGPKKLTILLVEE